MKAWLFVLSAFLALHTAVADPSSDSVSLIRGNTAFALELYRLQAQQGRGNIVFSPYSVSTAMAMVAAGAKGPTALEIEKALHFPFGGLRLTRAWAVVQSDMNRSRTEVVLTTANALWAARDVEFRPQYLALARNDFGAKLETLDFAQPEAARRRINAWVGEATSQKIPALIGPGLLTPSTRLVLTNAIYMKADWLKKFPRGRTNENGRFHTPAGDRKAAMMTNRDEFRFLRSGGVRIIELPYRGSKLSMLVILPDAADGLPNVEKALTVEKLAEWDRGLATTLVDVTFPRFRTDLSVRLGTTLRAMGIEKAFSGKADLSGIAEEPLFISEVIHKARIDVAEEGTEAAAATAVLMVGTARAGAPAPKPEIFNADHPFLFLIRRNDTKSVVFIGRLVQP